MKHKLRQILRKLTAGLSWRKVFPIILGAAICSFGIYNIHQQTGITEGGVIGGMLLVHHWFGISPSIITPILDLSCYLLAYKYLGGRFIKISIVSTASVSLFFKLWEMFPPILPDLSDHPLTARLQADFLLELVSVSLYVREVPAAVTTLSP